jgi:uncharacterized protein YggE
MSNTRKIGLFFVLALTVAVTFFSWQALTTVSASSARRETTITSTEELGAIVTTGSAEISVAPNVATVIVGVTALEKTAAEAQARVAADMAGVQQELKKLGIPDRNIQTRNFNVGAEYEYIDGKRNLVGYRASHDLYIKLTDLAAMGKTLDAVVISGATEIRNIQFGLSDDNELLQQALTAAVRDARAKAEALATGAGVKIVRVVRITDRSSGGPVIPIERSASFMVMAKDANTNIAVGEITVSAYVEVEFEFK